MVVRGPLVRSDILTQQEFVEERVKRGREAGRPCAVSMSSDLLEAMVVRHTQCLVDSVSCCLTAVGTEWAEPHVVGVLVGDQAARRDQRDEQMVIVGQHVQVVDVVREVRAEPRFRRNSESL